MAQRRNGLLSQKPSSRSGWDCALQKAGLKCPHSVLPAPFPTGWESQLRSPCLQRTEQQLQQSQSEIINHKGNGRWTRQGRGSCVVNVRRSRHYNGTVLYNPMRTFASWSISRKSQTYRQESISSLETSLKNFKSQAKHGSSAMDNGPLWRMSATWQPTSHG